jgi:hypothetical protein
MRRTNYFDVYVSRIIAGKTNRWVEWPEMILPMTRYAMMCV